MPWYGTPRGQLEAFARRWGIDLSGFAMHSLVSCTPPGYRLGFTPYEAPAATHCGGNLQRTIDQLQPKVIVPMGETALRYVLGESKILRHRGRVFEKDGRFIVPTFHPRDLLPQRGEQDKANIFEKASTLANPARFTGTMLLDLRLAQRVARDGFERDRVNYLCDPTPERFWLWVREFEDALMADPSLMLSWDIETPYKLKAKDDDDIDEKERDQQIIRISFSYKPGTGVSVEWSPVYLPAIRQLLATKGTHVVWNGDTFDVPLVTRAGVTIGGEVHDYMWAWHVLQSDLPKGLEYVSSYFSDLLPWKHLNNAEPARYSAIDADAALRNAIGIRQALQANGQYETFLRHVVQLDPILHAAGRRGSLIDTEFQAELRETLQAEKARIFTSVQSVVPDTLRPRKRFKRLPEFDGVRRYEEVATIGKVKRCTTCLATGVTAGAHFKGGKKNPCKAAGAAIEVIDGAVIEWDELLPFNPNSPDQLKHYMRFFGHPIGRDKKDRTKESANASHLERLAKRYKGHPLYGLTLEAHKVGKALGTYVEGFAVDEHGLIHTTYDHTPSTWRLASKAVNLQNVGKRESNKWAKLARKQIIARPGHVLVQADSSAIEAVFVGHFMGDEDYIRLARAGVHAYLACLDLGWEFNPANVKRVKREHETLYAMCKVVVHGTNFGMGPGLMVETNPHLFPTRSVAESWQKKLFDAVPGLKRWQTQTRIRAHKDTYLQNPWKHRHYFYSVLDFQPDGTYTLGPDAKRCVAFLPQSSAGSFMHDNLVLLAQTWLEDYMPAHVSVHDSLCVDVPVARADEAAATIQAILTRAIPEMGGLRVGCEIERGVNWAEMTTIATIPIAA